MSKHKHILALAVAAALVAGCAAGAGSSDAPSTAELDAMAKNIVNASFHDKGIVSVKQAFAADDETIRLCNAADVAGKPLDEATAKRIEALNMQTIKWPSDGKYLGDWKEGEKIAQSGRGMTWTDKAGAANGGNCYNCHQIDKKEISFGTIGPSLYQYGKLRGVTDPDSAAARPIVEYTWAKMWNAKAYNACSGMPRFGHGGLLDETQLKHLMALILDPKSPVNQ